jgi:hypothetical protein
MKRPALFPLALFLVAATFGTTAAQTAAPPALKDPNGFTSYVEFGGTSNGDGQVYEINSSLGYNFSDHFGMDVGEPMYMVHASSSTSQTSNNGFGNPYLTLRWKYLNPAVNFGSSLTGSAPVADSKKGFSTGRATFDWTNHFDHAFSRLTPFADIGLANTIPDSRFFKRPYTTLGFNTHFAGGANYDLWKFFSVSASAYDILPIGQQTVFSRIPGHAGALQHGRVFELNQQTKGGADIARDDGFTAALEASPGRRIDVQLGFTRSLHYDLNSVSFGIGFNLAKLYHHKDGQ